MPRYKHGSGSVYKRGKTWWIAYYGPDGKQVCESTKTTDKAEARRLLHTRLGQLAEGKFVGPIADRVTFEDLAELILADYKINGKKSLADVEQKLRLHLRPFFGGKRAHEITTADVDAYIAKRQEEVTYRKTKTSNGKINRELAALKRMFNLGLQKERIFKKPHIQMLAENNTRQGFFERWEFEAVLAKLADCLKAPFTFGYLMGWRVQSEVLPLTWSQVDLEIGAVRLEVGTTKNKGGRLIYLTDELQALLESQWQEHLTKD
jgi:integrase